MSSATPKLVQNCRRCSGPIAPGALVCEQCRSLVYSDELQQISAHAKSLESEQKFSEAREQWNAALTLLPADSKQALWIRDHVAELQNPPTSSAPEISVEQRGTKPLGASVAAFLISFALFLAFESYYGGLAFGIGFSVLILIHEFGHFVDVKRRGMHADLPVFIPGMGAFVRFQSGVISREVRAGVSLAGPFAGFLSAAACGMIWYWTGDRYWASLAQSAAWLNLLNLTPVWILDGGQAAFALSRMQRVSVLFAAIVLWAITKETVFFVVVAGALFRVIAKDTPPRPSPLMGYYFLAVLALLAAVMYIVPGTGFGIR